MEQMPSSKVLAVSTSCNDAMTQLRVVHSSTVEKWSLIVRLVGNQKSDFLIDCLK